MFDSVLINLLRVYLHTRVRGSMRTTLLLARHLKGLQAVPIRIGNHQILYVDLRDVASHDILRDAPYEAHPWEPDEQEVMRRVIRPGEVALDIGAHLGEHTILLSELVGPTGRVCAFEPNPAMLAPLGMTVGRLPNVRLFPFAVSDHAERTTLFVPDVHSMASLSDWTKRSDVADRGVADVQQVACEQRSLGDLIVQGLVPQPDFLKCDVEGAELQVFRGAPQVLDRADAPIVLYEANLWCARAFGWTMWASTDWLANLRAPAYSFFHVQPKGSLVPITSRESRHDHMNILAVPTSKLERVRPQ